MLSLSIILMFHSIFLRKIYKIKSCVSCHKEEISRETLIYPKVNWNVQKINKQRSNAIKNQNIQNILNPRLTSLLKQKLKNEHKITDLKVINYFKKIYKFLISMRLSILHCKKFSLNLTTLIMVFIIIYNNKWRHR